MKPNQFASLLPVAAAGLLTESAFAHGGVEEASSLVWVLHGLTHAMPDTWLLAAVVIAAGAAAIARLRRREKKS